jgi:putative peptidoglycan lipid II flippase
MLPISALMIALALPISRVVYERYAFTLEDAYLTALVLMAYAVGMFFYLGRDVLVRVFYALEDADTPFRISIFNIFLNALLDFLLVKPLGAPGLVLATVGVNIVSMVMMLWILHRRLRGLPLKEWAIPTVGLAVASAIAGVTAWGVLHGLEQWLGRHGFLLLLFQVCVAGLAGFLVFGLIAFQLKLPELNLLIDRVRQKFNRRRG